MEAIQKLKYTNDHKIDYKLFLELITNWNKNINLKSIKEKQIKMKKKKESFTEKMNNKPKVHRRSTDIKRKDEGFEQQKVLPKIQNIISRIS